MTARAVLVKVRSRAQPRMPSSARHCVMLCRLRARHPVPELSTRRGTRPCSTTRLDVSLTLCDSTASETRIEKGRGT